MPRRPRLFLHGGIYHVYCRVARGEFVFDEVLEANEFVDVLRRVRDLDGWTVFAWCLMSNHYHLVVRTEEIDLWRSMARFQGSVARSFNRRHRFLGRLWQSRYRARVVDSEEYFRQVVAYVHLNPVTAGLVTDPAGYAYSGHREIIGVAPSGIVDRQALLRSFNATEIVKPVDEYLTLLREVAESHWIGEDVSKLPWWTNAKNTDEVADAIRQPAATTFDGRSLAEQRADLGLAEFAARMECLSNHELEALSSRNRSGRILIGRIEFCTLAVGRYGLRTCDVASLLRKHPNSITNWLNRGLTLEREDPQFKNRIDRLDDAISQPR